MNLFYPYNRGALYTALIVLYSLTAGIAGYVAASYYKQVSAAPRYDQGAAVDADSMDGYNPLHSVLRCFGSTAYCHLLVALKA